MTLTHQGMPAEADLATLMLNEAEWAGRKPGGRPSHLKKDLMRVLRDGRERTTSEICASLKIRTESRKDSARFALKDLRDAGVLESDKIGGLVTWRRV